MPEQSISLQPGESKVVSFGVTPQIPKVYQVSVDGLTGSFKVVVVYPTEEVTIDRFEVRCDFPANFIYTRTTITNHTSRTYIDETPGTGLVAELWAAGYIGPKTPLWPYDRGLGFIFLPRVSNTRGVGNVPPGTHTYSGTFHGEATVLGPWFQHLGIVEGTVAYAEVRFRAGDERPTPMLWFVDVRQMFGGKFSSVWQRWEKTDWKARIFTPF